MAKQVEYYYKKWQVKINYDRDDNKWVWMIETDNNGPVFWHNTNGDKPSIEEVRTYIDENSVDWLC